MSAVYVFIGAVVVAQFVLTLWQRALTKKHRALVAEGARLNAEYDQMRQELIDACPNCCEDDGGKS